MRVSPFGRDRGRSGGTSTPPALPVCQTAAPSGAIPGRRHTRRQQRRTLSPSPLPGTPDHHDRGVRQWAALSARRIGLSPMTWRRRTATTSGPVAGATAKLDSASPTRHKRKESQVRAPVWRRSGLRQRRECESSGRRAGWVCPSDIANEGCAASCPGCSRLAKTGVTSAAARNRAGSISASCSATWPR